MSQLNDNLTEILRQKNTYLLPENLKKDVTCLGVTGTYEGDTKSYTELEYIESTGTQYIDTDYYITPTTRIVIDIQFTSTDEQQRAFGATTSSSSQTGGLRTYLYLNNGGRFGWNLQDNSNNNIDTNVNVDTNRHIFDLDSYNNIMSMDNGNTYTSAITTVRTNNGLVPLYLLTLNQYNMAEYPIWNAKAKLYSCKIYDNNVLVHYFIPVKRKSDDEICLYDKITNTFFTNQGTGDFIAGPEINLALMNIYVQTTEPVTKKGIWLSTSDKIIEHVVASDNVITTSAWLPAGTKTDVPDSFLDAGAVSYIGTDIYLFCDNGNNTNYKYNTLTDTYTQIANFPFLFRVSPAFVTIGTDIYIIAGLDSTWNFLRTIYKYDTINNTFTQINTTIPLMTIICRAASVGTDIYMFGMDYELSDGVIYNYKYNTLTNTYTKMTNSPYDFSYGSCIAVGTDIYMFGGQDSNGDPVTTAYKYDTLTDTYTQLTNIPYGFNYGSTALIGDNIYILGAFYTGNTNGFYFYKYNISTDTYTQVDTVPQAYIPDNYYNLTANKVAAIGNDIYLYGAYSDTTTNDTAVNVYQVQSEFPDNSVVLLNGNTYKTQLFSNELIDGSLKYSFADVWFYTSNNGFIANVPTYYGDGTQWINIKNPPVSPIETVEEEDEEDEEEEGNSGDITPDF